MVYARVCVSLSKTPSLKNAELNPPESENIITLKGLLRLCFFTLTPLYCQLLPLLPTFLKSSHRLPFFPLVIKTRNDPIPLPYM